jgi:hypothetical protein
MTIHYDVPKSRPQIVASLTSVHEQATTLWRRFTPLDFYRPPIIGGWSAAQNVEHLVKSMAPVATALRLPRVLLRVLFGAAHAPSRTFTHLRDDYRAVLAKGAEAGKFGPHDSPPPSDPAASYERLLARWQKLLPNLTDAIDRWDEAALDHYRLPHPLLGKLTVREMLFFTIYHIGHHAAIVAGKAHV